MLISRRRPRGELGPMRRSECRRRRHAAARPCHPAGHSEGLRRPSRVALRPPACRELPGTQSQGQPPGRRCGQLLACLLVAADALEELVDVDLAVNVRLLVGARGLARALPLQRVARPRPVQGLTAPSTQLHCSLDPLGRCGRGGKAVLRALPEQVRTTAPLESGARATVGGSGPRGFRALSATTHR